MASPQLDLAGKSILKLCGAAPVRLAWVQTFGAMMAAGILFVLLRRFSGLSTPELFQAAALIAALTATVLAGIQWRAARQEISFDKYYERLEKANSAFDAHRRDVLKEKPELLSQHSLTMFVFSEIDNLEYVLEKYKLGYVRDELVLRALRTFSSRCADGPFRNESFRWLGKDETSVEIQGYNLTTRESARIVLRLFEPKSIS